MVNKVDIKLKTSKAAKIYEERIPGLRTGRQFRDGTNPATGGRQLSDGTNLATGGRQFRDGTNPQEVVNPK